MERKRKSEKQEELWLGWTKHLREEKITDLKSPTVDSPGRASSNEPSAPVATLSEGARNVMQELASLGAHQTNVRNLDRALTKIPDAAERSSIEVLVLRLYMARMKGGLRLLGIRTGIILIAVAAESKPQQFEKNAEAMFPDIPARTRRHYMRDARAALREFGINVPKKLSAESASRIRNDWTLSELLRRTEMSQAQQIGSTPGPASQGTDKKPAPSKRKNAGMVRLETFRIHLGRSTKAFAKLLSDIGRLRPLDVGKAEQMITKLENSSLQKALKEALKNQGGRLEAHADPAAMI